MRAPPLLLLLLLLALAGSATALLQHTPGIKYCLTNPTAANCTTLAKLPIGAACGAFVAAPLQCMPAVAAASCCRLPVHPTHHLLPHVPHTLCAAAKSWVYLTGPTGQPGTPDAAIPKVCRVKETNLGDGVANAMLRAVRWSGRTAGGRARARWLWYTHLPPCPAWPCHAQPQLSPHRRPPLLQLPTMIPRHLAHLPRVAIVNGGAIRASLPAGAITVEDVHRVSPFGDTLVVKRVNASTLVAALAHGVSLWNADPADPAGRFPQVRASRAPQPAAAAAGGAGSNRGVCVRPGVPHAGRAGACACTLHGAACHACERMFACLPDPARPLPAARWRAWPTSSLAQPRPSWPPRLGTRAGGRPWCWQVRPAPRSTAARPSW